ncbi:MAG: fatty acid desaturase [Cyanobacteriota bacterium]|nr:fatty acid desaturase [Cyanobacteriota bacterium]
MTATTRRGLLLAAGIVLGWLGSLVILLPTTLANLSSGMILLSVLGRTLLQTGLFIVAHDAMHGTLWPERPGANQRIGESLLLLYAGLPYAQCLANHRRHHLHAGSAQDPDHHPEGKGGLAPWFCAFMAAYLSPRQITLLAVLWLTIAVLAAGFSASPLTNVGLYCILPTLLSSFQLFFVGTYVPHRKSGLPLESETTHCPRSLDCPPWISLLCCYHFGYHWEHHAFPHLAWHQLPQARRQIKDRIKTDLPFAVSLIGR